MLIYQLSFIRPHPRIILILLTSVTPWSRIGGHTEMEMMNDISFIKCISAEHVISCVYMNIQCHFLLSAQCGSVSVWVCGERDREREISHPSVGSLA